MKLHHTLRKRIIPAAAMTLTSECHKGVWTCCIPTVLMILTTVAGHDRAAEAKKEGNGKSDLRLGRHCRNSCFDERLNLPFVQ
jgi:hypothetical protein